MSRPLQTLATGHYFEAPRWRDGFLWIVDSIARSVFRMSAEGSCEIVLRLNGIPAGLGFLPTGDLISTSMLERVLLKGIRDQVTTYADLSTVTSGTIDDMIVDGEGRCFVGDLGFDLRQGVPAGALGGLILVAADGRSRTVAEGLRFPNGIAISADGSELVVAESQGDCLAAFRIGLDGSLEFRRRFGHIAEPDGICLDREGGVWVSAFNEDAVVRVDRAGRVTDRIALPGRGVACVLGGDDRRSLYCISAETTHEDLARRKSISHLHMTRVEIPGAGHP